jgi:hypothetical protein
MKKNNYNVIVNILERSFDGIGLAPNKFYLENIIRLSKFFKVKPLATAKIRLIISKQELIEK